MGKYAFCLVLFFVWMKAEAQLANGAVAPDFTVTDINGVPYSLYTKMGGKGACVAFDATWCGICWQFHQDGVLQNIYNNLSADATTVFLESDFTTNTNCLYGMSGCNSTTHGDWVTGSPYQICDLSPSNGPNVKTDYAQTYWPTIYVISPDKRAWEVRNLVYTEFVNWLTKSFKLSATGTPTNCTCGDNGKVILNVSGGYGTLSYNWSNGSNAKDLVNVAGGNYSVTITDANGYFKTFGPWSISNPPKQVDITNAQLTNVKCYNELTGSIDITVAYGTPPYSYSWSNSKFTKNIDKLKAGNYTVTVSDNAGCTRTKTYEIIQPTDLILSASTSKDDCDEMNGSISVKAIGGVPPYSFDIGLGKQQTLLFSDLKGGKDYTITLTDDNTCVETLKVTVDVTHKPKANTGIQKSFVNCNTQTLLLDGSKSSQGPAYTYLWTTTDGHILKGEQSLNPEITTPGKYDLKVTDVTNKCIDVESTTVLDQRTYPNIQTEGDTTLNCKLTETTLKGRSDTLPVVYHWIKANDSLFYQAGNTLTVTDSGAYVLWIRDTLNSCEVNDTVFIQKDQQKPIALAMTPNDISCKFPEVILDGTASEKGPGIEYIWSTVDGHILSGANSLSALINKGGEYVLRVLNTTNYCEQEASVHVIQHELPVADFFHTTNGLEVKFEDQSTGVPTTWKWNFGEPGSTDNISFEKNPTHIYASGGQYHVTLIVENDCGSVEKTDEKVYAGTTAPLSLNGWILNVKCFGGSDGAILLDVQGGIPPFTYAWSNQQTSKDLVNQVAGIYSVVVTDQQGSKVSKSFEILQGPEIQLNQATITNTLAGQNTGSIFLDMVGGNSFSFQWSNGQTVNPVQALAAGDYSCTVTDGNFCSKELGPFTVKEITGLNDADLQDGITQFSIFPNPVGDIGMIRLKFASVQKWQINLVTVLGKEIWSANEETREKDLVVNCNQLHKGIYFVVLQTGKTQKILKWIVQ